MFEKKKTAEKVSKADFIRGWLKSNKDFSSKWINRLLAALQKDGYKVAKHDSIYVYSIKSQLERLSKTVMNKTKKTIVKKDKLEPSVPDKPSVSDSHENLSDLYRVAGLAWSLKSWLDEKSSNYHELQQAINLLKYLEQR